MYFNYLYLHLHRLRKKHNSNIPKLDYRDIRQVGKPVTSLCF